jgi:hypothetical protein
MSAFSFTAPFFSEEDEKEERDALTNEERKQVHDDMFGMAATATEETTTLRDANENDEKLKRGLVLFWEALEQIPPVDKAAYLEAVERAPDLVARETCPVAFVRGENYDAWAAASRFVAYWKNRRLTFGPDRFILPMTLNGAIAEDIQAFMMGLAFVLPDDEKGRAVLFFDRIRLVRSVISRDEVIRILFYFLQVMLDDNSVQTGGYVTITNFKVRLELLCWQASVADDTHNWSVVLPNSVGL